MLLDSLNEQQKIAAEIIQGPVMVFAGAGSGKTRTLTYRIANMMASSIDPRHILAITFTNKATNEMRERLQQLVGPHASLLTISTFHSLCASILRKEIGVLGYSNRFSILDDEDQLKVIGEVIEEAKMNKKIFTPKHMRKKINWCKCFDLKSDIPAENKIMELYETKMKEEDLLDFEDLLIKVREILRTCPDILLRYQKRFQYILVDEFQDTDLIQYQIIKLLAREHRNIFVVGDDDQSIYSFRGTNYANMSLFKEDFPEHQLIILNQNYRSTQTILDGCNNLIANNKDRQPKSLFSTITGSDQDVVVHQAKDENDEVQYVIDEIKKLIKQGYSHQDIAVLYRSSVVSRNFELGFIRADLPYRVFGGLSYLRRREIKDVIAYFRLIVFPNDIQSFKRIVNTPSRGIGTKTIEAITGYKQQQKITLDEALNQIDVYLPSRTTAIREFIKLIGSFRARIEQENLVTLYQDLLEKTGYLTMLEDDEDKEERIANLMEFKSILYTIENSGEIATRSDKLIAAFDEAILSDDKLQSQKHDHHGITLSTIHSVKGLEFAIVFVVAFENNIFPNLYRSVEEASNLEEERRIAYVATTRAKTKLYLTCAFRRLLYGQANHNPQSMFLVEFAKNRPLEPQPQIVDFEEPVKPTIKSSNSYMIGDILIHSTYGEGILVSLSGDIGKICFAKQGFIKTFDMTHPAIRKKEEEM